MSVDGLKIVRGDTILIKNIQDGVVTITSKDNDNQGTENCYIYKVSPTGELITNKEQGNMNHVLTIKKTKEMLMKELHNNGFEEIPSDLTELQIEKLLEFSKKKIDKSYEYSRMFPFSAEIISNGNLKVILLMYNGTQEYLPITKFPFKIKDANGEVQVIDIIDINKTVSPFKISICEVEIDKSKLKDEFPDLTKWTITFELQ